MKEIIKKCADKSTAIYLWNKIHTDNSKHETVSVRKMSLILPSLLSSIKEQDILNLVNQRHIKEINLNQFLCMLASLGEDKNFKAKIAFENLLQKNHQKIKYDDFLRIAELIISDESIIKKIFTRLDASGLGEASEEDFINFLPSIVNKNNKVFSVIHEMDEVEKNEKNNNEIINIDENKLIKKDLSGTSPLQLQIGFFRLMQGASYRCFRASFTANSETHLRAYNLPYTISNFVNFTNKVIKLYIDSGVIESKIVLEAEKLRGIVNKEYHSLKNRIINWENIDKNEHMLRAENIIDNENIEIEDEHDLFFSIIEIVLSIGIDDDNHFTIDHADMALNEINRLRLKEELNELKKLSKLSNPNSIDEKFINSWHRVIIDEADTHIAGSIMPVKFWYEKFMPQLLRMCSAHTNNEIDLIDQESENDLNDWFNTLSKNGDFDPYAIDVQNHFLQNNIEIKKRIKQAWRLSEHYLNGVQKRREREEFGRNDGYLSEYVTFIDIYLGRNDVEISEMRISFPYFIGPATWRFMHTMAEISCGNNLSNKFFIDDFKNFFRSLATVYPCPYCRYHLNKYVVQNKEIKRYPLEYLFLGFNNDKIDLTISLDDKLSTIEQPNDMRLFLWKLHNTVSSSIARSEEWFNSEKDPLYTNRYWPSLDTELERANAFSKQTIELSRIYKVYNLLKPVSKLETLRDEMQYAIDTNDHNLFVSCKNRFKDVLKTLEEQILSSKYLQDTYHYNPSLINTPPHFTPEDEAYSRSGHYYEN